MMKDLSFQDTFGGDRQVQYPFWTIRRIAMKPVDIQ